MPLYVCITEKKKKMSIDFYGNANVICVPMGGRRGVIYPYTLSLLKIMLPMFRLGCTPRLSSQESISFAVTSQKNIVRNCATGCPL